MQAEVKRRVILRSACGSVGSRFIFFCNPDEKTQRFIHCVRRGEPVKGVKSGLGYLDSASMLRALRPIFLSDSTLAFIFKQTREFHGHNTSFNSRPSFSGF